MMEHGEGTIAVSQSKDIIEILKACYLDKELFCLTFLRDNFYHKFSGVHRKILNKMNIRCEKKKVGVCGTRGIGKTSLARAEGVWSILYGEKSFIVYLGKSATHAEMQTENMKKDLMSTEVRQVFGSVKVRVVGDVEESWSKKCWVAAVGTGDDKHYTFVLPRGARQQVRGLVWKSPTGENIRPDLIIADDVEDPEEILNEEIRAKNKIWFMSDVMRCFSMLEKNWEVFYIDSLKHEDSLMQLILDSKEWDTVITPICDENYKSLAPDFMSDEEIEEEIKQYREKGMMDIFAREIMCTPISSETATFKSAYFRYFDDVQPGLVLHKKDNNNEVVRLDSIINVVIYDPAKTVNKGSAETGFVVWGVDLTGNRLFLRYAAGEKLHSDQTEDRAIELALQYGAHVIGVETSGLHEYVSYPLRNEIIRRGLVIEVVELVAKRGVGEFSGVGGGKKMRISSLSSYYRRGLVWHNMVGVGAYETQLLGFPRSKRVDIIDAGSYITSMLEKGGIFFCGQDHDEDERIIEKEYEELEAELGDDDKLSDGWRCAP